MRRIVLVSIALLLLVGVPGLSCTFFSLAQDGIVLFGSNEDWSDPDGRLWVMPADGAGYGCVFLGFSDLFAEGGQRDGGSFRRRCSSFDAAQ